MYIRFWNKRINTKLMEIPLFYEVRDSIKIEENVDNIEIPKYDTGNTYLVFGYIITKRAFTRSPGVVKNDHFICHFTDSFQSAINMIDAFSNKNKRHLSKYVSMLRIYEFSKESTDVLYTDFHNGAQTFMAEIYNTDDYDTLRKIYLKYADYYRYVYKYNKTDQRVELSSDLSGYVYHNSDIFSGETAGHDWCDWYKHEYMECI